MVTENPDMEGITRFVCHIYGFKTESSINHARFLSFKKMTGGKLSRVKTVNCSSLPPCQKVLDKHINRSCYVAHMWRNADKADPMCQMSPSDYGWMVDEHQNYVHQYFDGPSLPDSQLRVDDVDDVDNEEEVENLRVATEGEQWTDDSDEED